MSASRLAGQGQAATEPDVIRDALLEPGQILVVPVDDAAMRPWILPGDLVEVVPFLGLPRPGQVVVARVSGILKARRLESVEMIAGRRRYRLGGDAGAEAGAGVLRDDLLGRVAAVVRQGRRMGVVDRPAAGRRPGRP